jgi:hypothetical protein
MLGSKYIRYRCGNVPSGVPSWRAPSKGSVTDIVDHANRMDFIPVTQFLQKLMFAEGVERMGVGKDNDV